MDTLFVNRTQQKEKILELAKSSSGTTLIYINGDGGIGKTRFLREIPSWLPDFNFISSDDDLKIIDFDDKRWREGRFIFRLAKLINDRETIHELNKLRLYRKRVDDLQVIDDQSNAVVLSLARTLNQSKEKKILLFDTVEKIDEETIEEISKVVEKLDSCICIFSGRNFTGSPFNMWQSGWNSKTSHRLDFEPFTNDASRQFLDAKLKQLSRQLSPEVINAIISFSGGFPILLDLSAEYALHEVDITDLLNINKKTSKENTLIFKSRLVDTLSRLPNPISQVVFLLWWVYPLNQEMIQIKFKWSNEDCKRNILSLKSYSFIKILYEDGQEFYQLHDILRALISDYGWEKLSIDSKWQYSQWAKNIFQEQDIRYAQEKRSLENEVGNDISSIDRNEDIHFQIAELGYRRALATANWLRHSLSLDIKQGFAEWKTVYDDIRYGKKYRLALRLVNLLSEYENVIVDEEDRFSYKFRQAQSYIDRHKFPEALKILELLQEKYKDDKIKRRSILNLQATYYMHQANYNDALSFYQKSRELSVPVSEISKNTLHTFDLKEIEFIARTENQIGWCYRNLEDVDSDNLKYAEQHYSQALFLARHLYNNANDKQKKQAQAIFVAACQTNLGYLNVLRKKFNAVNTYFREALLLLNEYKRFRDMAPTKTAWGISKRDEGFFEDAIKLFKEAIEPLTTIDDYGSLCRAYFHMGWAQWFQADNGEEINKPLLEIAEQSLAKALEIADEYHIQREMPGILHQYASVIWRLGKRDEARSLNDKALEKAKEIKSYRYWIDAIIGKAEFDNDLVRSNTTKEMVREYQNRFDGYKIELEDFENQLKTDTEKIQNTYALYYGRFYRLEGDLALLQGNYPSAFGLYAIAFPLMRKHGGFGPFSIRNELKRFETLIFDIIYRNKLLSTQESIGYLMQLRDAWKNTTSLEGLDSPSLYAWAQDQIEMIQKLVDIQPL